MKSSHDISDFHRSQCTVARRNEGWMHKRRIIKKIIL